MAMEFDDCIEERNARASEELIKEKRSYKQDILDNKKLRTMSHKAVRKFLEARDYEILREDFEFVSAKADFIAIDGDKIVFVLVDTVDNMKHGFPVEDVDPEYRRELENLALNYLAITPYTDMAIRFDIVTVVPIGTDKAMIRHHINALN